MLILDRVGHLKECYALGDVAFVGGSLVDRGGQNPLEAVHGGCPVAMGPHFEHFESIVGDLLSAGALYRVGDEAELADAFERLLRDRELREEISLRARSALLSRKGASEHYVEKIVSTLVEYP